MTADATSAHCAAENARFYRPGAPADWPAITSPEAAADVLLPMLERLDREHCVTLNLDTKHRLIAATTVSIGSIDHTFMVPREVFRDALLHNASAVVLAHNHPSGDETPSRDDELITKRLVRAGEVIGVDVLDHLVVGRGRWTSLARKGVLGIDGFDHDHVAELRPNNYAGKQRGETTEVPPIRIKARSRWIAASLCAAPDSGRPSRSWPWS